MIIQFDGGAMDDFVSSKVIRQLKLTVSPATTQVLSFANGKTFTSDQETRPLSLVLGLHQEEIVLRETPLSRHQVILGSPRPKNKIK
jgi:hypothetical protein